MSKENPSILVKAQCKYKHEDGRQCTKITTYTHPYCAAHTKKVFGLRVAPSQIKFAGLGLWAEKSFKKGEYVVEYAGERITTKQYDERYGDEAYGSYGMGLSTRTVIDARKTDSGLGRYVCDHYGSGLKPNVRYIVDKNKVQIEALRKIEPGEEFLVSYGAAMRKAMGIKK